MVTDELVLEFLARSYQVLEGFYIRWKLLKYKNKEYKHFVGEAFKNENLFFN